MKDEGHKDEKQESRVNAVSGCENSDGGNEKQQVGRRIKRGLFSEDQGVLKSRRRTGRDRQITIKQ